MIIWNKFEKSKIIRDKDYLFFLKEDRISMDERIYTGIIYNGDEKIYIYVLDYTAEILDEDILFYSEMNYPNE